MEDLANLMQSAWFAKITSAYGIVTLMLALALFIVCAVEYARGVARFREGTGSEPWLMVISTLRDTFTVSALYIVIDMLRGAIQYRDGIRPTFISYVGLFQPFVELFIFGLIVYVIFRRLFILRDWLERNASK